MGRLVGGFQRRGLRFRTERLHRLTEMDVHRNEFPPLSDHLYRLYTPVGIRHVKRGGSTVRLPRLAGVDAALARARRWVRLGVDRAPSPGWSERARWGLHQVVSSAGVRLDYIQAAADRRADL